MPTMISDIVQKSAEINQAVEFWEFSNPRLFKGVVPEEENNLFILITKESDEASVDMLAIALRELLPCPIYLSEEDELNPEYKVQVLKQAVSLSEEAKLLELFENINFGEKPTKLTEEEQQTQAHELDVFNFVKEAQEKKRKLSQEVSHSPKQGFFRAEKKIKIEEEFSNVINSSETPEKKGEQIAKLVALALNLDGQLSCARQLLSIAPTERRQEEIKKISTTEEQVYRKEVHTM